VWSIGVQLLKRILLSLVLNNTELREKADFIIAKDSNFLEGQIGVITQREFHKGDKLFSVKGPILSQPTKYSFSVDLDKHIDPLKDDGSFDLGHFLNHSCNPNTFIKIVNRASTKPFIDIIARRDIKTGEELTFDYASLEYDTVTKTVCKCGTSVCRGTIHGFKDLPEHIKKEYEKEGMIPAYLLNIKRT